jgi:hypothetical protein
MSGDTPKPVYSPVQAGASTLLGGPLAGAHLIWSNFIALGQRKQAQTTVIIAVSVTAVLLLFGFANKSSEHAGPLVGLILALGARQAVEIYQVKKEAIAGSTEYSFQSNWKVLGIGLAWLILILILVFFITFLLIALGIDPDE